VRPVAALAGTGDAARGMCDLVRSVKTERTPGHSVLNGQAATVWLFWALGALASVLLSLAHLPFGLTAFIVSSGPWWAFAFSAILLVQAGLCLACAVGFFDGRAGILAAAVAVVTVAHAVAATLAWPDYSAYLWMLWIGPMPMLAPALIAAAVSRRRRSP
jgi:hypothetical protein